MNGPGLAVSTGVRIVTLLVVIFPFLGVGVVTATILLWGHGIRWTEAGLLAAMYTVVRVGITVGYHRLFTHRSFETNRMVRCVPAVLGSMALQGPVGPRRLAWNIRLPARGAAAA